ncbi:MAG: efflux RND transporter permease subunit [Deltaproteobacteria bacterium]|nr:efflux RND transporter permease subunit [Deltaproteobacteria bacterium]MBW2361520.1 efflux RND transporter permease subunit [Deltaproteobacteria bacterium]
MILSDISIRRPVLATVLSALLVTFGLLSFRGLPVREIPDVDPPVVSVEVAYRGASAAVAESRITLLLEESISGIEGIRSISSQSRDGESRVSIEFELDRDIEAAANDVRSAVARVADRLPEEADAAQVVKADTDARPIMWFNLSSTELGPLELTDFAERYVEDRFAVIDGVGRVRVSGARRYAMRIWLDRVALAARELTVGDVEATLRRQNVELPAGRLESQQRDLTVRVERGYTTPEDFRRLVLARGDDGHLIRLGEVARVEEGPEEWRSEYRGNGVPQVGIGIVKRSGANTLSVAREAHAVADSIRPSLPEGTILHDSWDSSNFVAEAITEVYKTLSISVLLVVAVIYLFLGTLRAALVPALTVPICLVAAFSVLNVFGFSVNMLTLLALVLSIGLVVDDSIVVLENAQRRIELGEPPLLAAFRGTREVGFAVVSTSLIVIAVFVPIAFLEGLTGRLFRELAVTVSAAVAFSSLVALSLSAMLCSKLLRPSEQERGLNRFTHGAFEAMRRGYATSLAACLRHRTPVMLGLVGLLLVLTALFRQVPSELEPLEDRGGFMMFMRGPEGASYNYSVRQMRGLEQLLFPLLDAGEAKRILTFVPSGFTSGGAMNGGFGIIVLEHWRQRRSLEEILGQVAEDFHQVPGVRAYPFPFRSMGGSGRPVQLAVGGSDHEEVGAWQEEILARIGEIPGLERPEGDYQPTRPQLRVTIDHTRAADLGVSVEEVGRTLETMLGSRHVTTYVRRGEEYNVILQAAGDQRETPQDLRNIYVRADAGDLIPLSNLVSLREVAEPGTLRRFNRLPAATIDAGLAPGVVLGNALDGLEALARDVLPPGARIELKGTSREFRESTLAAYFTFGLALLIVFLVLAGQFESFSQPLAIMLTVPLAVTGAFLGLWLTDGTLNIYSQIGITILVGLSAKNGILIVEFANQLRETGHPFEEALVEAAHTRLRPILMTGLSTSIGALPLILTGGAGSAGRSTIGIVIFSGVLFATCFTLFVVPVAYTLFARRSKSSGAVARALEDWDRKVPDPRATAVQRDGAGVDQAGGPAMAP